MKKLLLLMLTAVAAFAFKIAGSGYKAGDIATDFKLKNVNGKIVSMADYTSAKGFIVIFTCNHCPVAQAYEKRIMALDAKYASKGYPVIAISPNDPVAEPVDSYANMQKRAAERNYTFPYLIDETQNITRVYGAQATPTVYLLQKTANGLVVQYTGAIDNDQPEANAARTRYVENAVNALLDNKKPEVTGSKAFGCRIVWKSS
ncbi:MAG: Peroxiredoxin [Mucilaginibacter sp.]|nr:Peroxiredoxin [Mucilaginibacter sp.]